MSKSIGVLNIFSNCFQCMFGCYIFCITGILGFFFALKIKFGKLILIFLTLPKYPVFPAVSLKTENGKKKNTENLRKSNFFPKTFLMTN